MNKIFKKLIPLALSAAVTASAVPALAVGTPYEVKLSGSVDGVSMTEDKVEFKRMGAKSTEDKTGYYYSPISTTGDFYVDIKVRIPKESVAAMNYRLSFASFVDASGKNGSWLIPFSENAGLWTSKVNGETVKHKYRGNDWWTFRLIFKKDDAGIYNMTVLNVNAKAEYETWASGSLNATSLNGWMVTGGSGGDSGVSLYDLAQFEVKMGSPEGDNNQLETAKNFIEEPDFTEIKNESERNMYKELYSLGLFDLMEDNAVHPGDNFTKKQMADTLVRLYGIDTENYLVEDLIYRDLTDEKKHKNCLIAVNAGYMNADNETLFGVEDKITYGDMADYMLKLLGYGTFLDFSEEIQESRFQYAASIGMFDGADATDYETTVTRKNAAIIINNVKDMKVIEVKISSSGTTFSEGDKTVLNKYSDIYEEKNVMLDADNDTGLYSAEDATEKDVVSIDGIEYNVGSCDLSNLSLGTMLDILYRYDEAEDTRTLIKVDVRKDSNVYVIEDDNLISINDNELTADFEDKTKRFKYEKPKVVYNKRAADSMISLSSLIGDIDDFRGKITFVDNASETDVLIIEKYETIVVKAVDVAQNIIYDKYGNNIVLEEDNYSIKSVADVETEIEQLAVNDVLTVMESLADKNGKSFKTVYYSKSILKDGVIKSVDSDDRRQYAKIGESEYCVIKELSEYAKNNHQQKIALNMEADFLLDIYGDIAGFINVNQEIIGYVVKVRLTETDDGEETVYMKVFNSDAVMEELNLRTEKCMIDGTVKKTAEEQYLALTKDNTTVEQTVVKYKKNAEGFITTLDTLNKDAGGINDTVTRVAGKALRMYHSGGSTYTNKVGISSDAVKFVVPIPGTEMFEDDANFSLGLQNNKDTQVNEAYSTDGDGVVYTDDGKQADAGVANVVITYSPTLYSTERPILVTDVKTVWNEKYDEVQVEVTGYDAYNSVYKTYTIKSDAAYGNILSPLIKKGYVFSAAFDAHGNIIDNISSYKNMQSPFTGGNAYVYVDEQGNAITKDADGNTLNNSLNATDSSGEKSARHTLGNVLYSNGEHMILKLTNNTYETYGMKNAKVFELMGTGKNVKIEERSINSINVGDKAYVYTSSSNAKMIIIYR